MSLEKIKEVEEIVALMMDSTIESLKRDLSTIHAGRVSPSMLDNVKVDYYGTPTPINQVANISTPEPQLLAVSPWEKKMIKEITIGNQKYFDKKELRTVFRTMKVNNS